MDFLIDWRWMIGPLLACLLLSVTLVYMGIHVLARKVIFVDLALAQIAALGATYATVLGYDAHEPGDTLAVALFSLAFTFAGAGIFAIARMRKEKVPQEAFIGIVYASAAAAAILILSKSPTGGEELKHMLVGDILLVSMPTILSDALLFSMVGVLHVIFRKKFLAISVDAEAAEGSGIHIRAWDLLFYMTFGVLVTRSVAVAGVLLVFSYLVIPAVIAQMWKDTILGRLMFGWISAVLASLGGIVWSFYSDYPTGPAIVIMLAFFLIVSGMTYYVSYSATRLRAFANVVSLVLAGTVFFLTLAQFGKPVPERAAAAIPVADKLLEEIKTGGVTAQLDAISHLAVIEDPRIVPALEVLLARTESEQVVESIAEVLARKGDRQAVPVLREAAVKDYDHFLKLTIAKASIALGDSYGFDVALGILRNEDAGFARIQAVELIQSESGLDFGYSIEASPAEQENAIDRIERWVSERGSSR